MEVYTMALTLAGLLFCIGAGFCYWRFVWFFRNPDRFPPSPEGILSPADGTVVYAKRIRPLEPVLVIKKGMQATVDDIAREHMEAEKILIGVFMSPFNVHHNRSPITGTVELVRHYPARLKNTCMWSMHLRTILRRAPYYRNSPHVIQNERTVTRIKGAHNGEQLTCYIVQIAGRSVRGIESYVQPGTKIERGALFGMIRIGSQVDLIMPWKDGMQIMVRPGDKVRAGESILVK